MKKYSGREFSKISDRYQITDTGSSKNTKQDKYQKILYLSSYIQTLKNQRQRLNLERSQRKKKKKQLHYLQRNSDKNYIGLLFRNHRNYASKKRMEWNI